MSPPYKDFHGNDMIGGAEGEIATAKANRNDERRRILCYRILTF